MTGPSAKSRRDILATLAHPPGAIAAGFERIRREVLDTSRTINAGNFLRLGEDDLARLFRLYDAQSFGGMLSCWLHEDRAGAITFRVSPRMSRAGGKTIRTRLRPTRLDPDPPARYEIAVGSTLLFQTFVDPDRPVEVVGLPCRDRLDALQRIFEHELIHLAEFLASGRSSCAAAPFQEAAGRIFGHERAVHDLVTSREIAATEHGVRVGDRVAFDLDGTRIVGRINRITRRATVLVESPAGALFSDGRRYERYYVPLPMLRKAP